MLLFLQLASQVMYQRPNLDLKASELAVQFRSKHWRSWKFLALYANA